MLKPFKEKLIRLEEYEEPKEKQSKLNCWPTRQKLLMERKQEKTSEKKATRLL